MGRIATGSRSLRSGFTSRENSSVSTREPSAAGSCPAPRAAAHSCPDTDVGDIQGIGCARVCSLQFARLDARGITFARFHPDPPRRSAVSTTWSRPAWRASLLMLTAALIAGLLGVTARPAAAGHAPASVFGADVREYHLNQLVVDPMPGSDQSYAKAAGLDWIRAGISWPDAQPAKPDAGVTSQIPGCTGSACFWNQDYMDRQKTLVKKLTDRGYTPIVVVYGAPDWVNGAHKPCWVPDEHFDTFATFLNAAVKEFKASGIPLEHWQIWNEPEASIENFGGNMDQGIGCFGVKGNAKTYGGDRYARFMQKSYKAVKDADATAKVISGGAELGCHDC